MSNDAFHLRDGAAPGRGWTMIKIEWDGAKYVAGAHVGPELADLPGVFQVYGGSDPEGAWISGAGNSPEEALIMMFAAIGRAYLHPKKLPLEGR